MKAEEYKRVIAEQSVLDFGTLKVKEQLDKIADERLVSERILNDNKLTNPYFIMFWRRMKQTLA